MSSTWLQALLRRTHTTRSPLPPRPAHAAPDLEELEPRVVPTTAVTTNHIVGSTATISESPPVGPTTKVKGAPGPVIRGKGDSLKPVTTKTSSATEKSGKLHVSPFTQVENLSRATTSFSSPGSSAVVGLTPAQIETYYGVNHILLTGGVVGNGAGQTIAIIDAYNNPYLVSSSAANFATSDLGRFDAAFGIPSPAGFFTKVNQSGVQGSYPATSTGWAFEEDLDVEWAHAMAPQAKIILVEANGTASTSAHDGINSLMQAVNTARNIPAVSVISMSWGVQGALTDPGAGAYDAIFQTPAGHQGITFLASAGDHNAPAAYPSDSPFVVAVGGTVLTPSGGTFTESGWGHGNGDLGSSSSWGGGGGPTSYPEPSYQQILIPTTTYGDVRTSPDVSFDAGTGVAVVHQLYDGGGNAYWFPVGGTSLASPCWAGLISIADQGRVLDDLGTMNGYTQTLPRLYTLANNQYNHGGPLDFNDITTGNNGYAAGPGYDLNTGIGSPNASVLIDDLVQGPHIAIGASGSTVAGAPLSLTVMIVNVNGTLDTTYTGTVHFSATDPYASLPANYTFTAGAGSGFDNGFHVFTATLVKAGTQTITVTDTTGIATSGSVPVVVTAGPATQFSLVEEVTEAGIFIVVTALDKYGNVSTNFTGTVKFSSATLPILPASYTFTGAGAGHDNGVHTFALEVTSIGIFDLELSSPGLSTLVTKIYVLGVYR